MRAELEASNRNSDKAMRDGGLFYTAEPETNQVNPNWAVVTWQRGKAIQREY